MSVSETGVRSRPESWEERRIKFREECSAFKNARADLDAKINACFLSLVPKDQQEECDIIISHNQNQICFDDEVKAELTLMMRLLYLKLFAKETEAKDGDTAASLKVARKELRDADIPEAVFDHEIQPYLFPVPQAILDAKPATERYVVTHHLHKIAVYLGQTRWDWGGTDRDRRIQLLDILYQQCPHNVFWSNFVGRDISPDSYRRIFSALQDVKNPDVQKKIATIHHHFMSDLTGGYYSDKLNYVKKVFLEASPGQVALLLGRKNKWKKFTEEFPRLSSEIIFEQIIFKPERHKGFLEAANISLLIRCLQALRNSTLTGEKITTPAEVFKKALSDQIKSRLPENRMACAKEMLVPKYLSTDPFGIIAEYGNKRNELLDKQPEATIPRAQEVLVPTHLTQDPFNIVAGYMEAPGAKINNL